MCVYSFCEKAMKSELEMLQKGLGLRICVGCPKRAYECFLVQSISLLEFSVGVFSSLAKIDKLREN